MDNNNENLTIGGTPNPNLNSGLNQPFDQPINQPIFQPIQNQPIIQPISNASNNNSQNFSKKTGLIIGCSVAIVAIIATIIALLFILPKHGEKIVSCTANTTMMGVTMTGETNVRVKDGEISGGDVTVNIDLKTMRDSYKTREEDMVDRLTEQYENLCEDHCTLDYNYIKGDSVKYIMQYDKEGVDEIVWSYGEEDMSAQEIADKVQEALEDSDTTCVQR